MLLLLGFPGEVAEAVERRAPHRIAAYALELAQSFTAFYRDCRVVGAEPPAVESFRIALSVAAMSTIARALDLLGVARPTGCSSVEAREVGLEPGGVAGGSGAASSSPCAARERLRQRGSRIASSARKAEDDGEGHEVGGDAEAVVRGQPEHGGAVLAHQRALDLRFVLPARRSASGCRHARDRPAATRRRSAGSCR